MIACRVPKDYTDAVRDMIRGAVELDETRDADYIREQIEADKFSPWMVLDHGTAKAAGVTKIDQIGPEKHLTIMYCEGADVPWRDVISEVEEFARSQGCSSVRIEGRPGWVKMLRSNGYINRPFLEKRL